MDRGQAERFDRAVKQMVNHKPTEHLHKTLHRVADSVINSRPSSFRLTPVSALCMELGKETMVDPGDVSLDDAALLCALAGIIKRQYVERSLDASGNVVASGNVYVYEGEYVSVAGYADGGMVCIETIDGCQRWTASNELYEDGGRA